MLGESDPIEYSAVTSLLQDLRKDAGLRQVDLAEKLGVPQSFVSKYESGERRLDIVEVHTLCIAMGRSLVEFSRLLEKRLGVSKK